MKRDTAALKLSPASPGAGLADPGAAASVPAELVPAELAPAELAPAEYALFAEVGRTRRCRAGETLFRRGDPGRSMYVVAAGAIDLEFGDDIASKRLGPREFFGELGLLIGDHARSADAVAPVAGTLVELGHEEFQRLVDRDPGGVAHFLRRAIGRVVRNEQDLIRRLRRRNQDLQMALDSLHATTHQLNQTEALVRIDDLTGLHNRRGLAQHLAERGGTGTPAGLGLILVDCDRFKLVNDQHGHVVGDRVLRSVAGVLRSVLREGDLACRLGGDEFCLLIQAASRETVLAVADFVIATTRGLLRMPHPTEPGQPPPICTVSLGACLVDAGRDWNDWYARADMALYRAKRLGGNRVEWQEDAGVAA